MELSYRNVTNLIGFVKRTTKFKHLSYYTVTPGSSVCVRLDILVALGSQVGACQEEEEAYLRCRHTHQICFTAGYISYIYIHIQLQRHDCNTTPGQHLAVTVRTRILPNKDSAKGLSKGTLKQAWIANSRVSWRHWHPLHWIATWWTTRP